MFGSACKHFMRVYPFCDNWFVEILHLIKSIEALCQVVRAKT